MQTAKTRPSGTQRRPDVRTGDQWRAHSTAIWLIIWLVVIECFVGWMKPLRYVAMPTMLFEDQDPLEIKVTALQNEAGKVNVLILGSSLAGALSSADDIKESDVGMIPAFKAYTKALAFDQAMNAALSVKAHSINLGIDACMISEDKVLFDHALAVGVKPKLIFVLVAPRDFISNTFKDGSHVEKFFAERLPFWQKINIAEIPQSLDQIAQSSTLYRNRGNFYRIAELACCGWIHRTPNLFYAQKQDAYWRSFRAPKFAFLESNKKQGAVGGTVTRKARASLVDYYKVDYLPVNKSRMRDQFSSLNALLDSATARGVIPVVVNMPRGSENEALLPEWFRVEFQNALSSACANHDCAVINFESSDEFNDADFTDGVHLSAAGSRKIFQLIAARLAADPKFRQQVTAAMSN